MTTFVIVLHIICAIFMIGIILIQKSDSGGALGMGGANPAGNFMTARGAANLLTRTTAILATGFFVTTITLALLFKGSHRTHSILNEDVTSISKPPLAVETQRPKVETAR